MSILQSILEVTCLFKSIYGIGDTVYFTYTRGRKTKLGKGCITGVRAIPVRKGYEYYYTINDAETVHNNVSISRLFVIEDIFRISIPISLLIILTAFYERMLG